jgi:hypothetical protein
LSSQGRTRGTKAERGHNIPANSLKNNKLGVEYIVSDWHQHASIEKLLLQNFKGESNFSMYHDYNE